MDHNTLQDNSGSHDESGTYNKRIDVLIARIEDHITLLLDGNDIDELSAYQREQVAATYTSLLLRFLILRQKVEVESLKSSEMTMEDFMESRWKASEEE